MSMWVVGGLWGPEIKATALDLIGEENIGCGRGKERKGHLCFALKRKGLRL